MDHLTLFLIILLSLCLSPVGTKDRRGGVPTTPRFLASSLENLGSLETAVCSNQVRFVVDTQDRTQGMISSTPNFRTPPSTSSDMSLTLQSEQDSTLTPSLNRQTFNVSGIEPAPYRQTTPDVTPLPPRVLVAPGHFEGPVTRDQAVGCPQVPEALIIPVRLFYRLVELVVRCAIWLLDLPAPCSRVASTWWLSNQTERFRFCVLISKVSSLGLGSFALMFGAIYLFEAWQSPESTSQELFVKVLSELFEHPDVITGPLFFGNKTEFVKIHE